MGGKTAILLTLAGIGGMAGALVNIMLNSPLLGYTLDLDAVFMWSFVFVFSVFVFGIGLSRVYLP